MWTFTKVKRIDDERVSITATESETGTRSFTWEQRVDDFSQARVVETLQKKVTASNAILEIPFFNVRNFLLSP